MSFLLQVPTCTIENNNLKVTVKNIGGKPSYNPAVKVTLSGNLHVSTAFSGESIRGSGTNVFSIHLNKTIPAGGEWTCTFPVEGSASVEQVSIISR